MAGLAKGKERPHDNGRSQFELYSVFLSDLNDPARLFARRIVPESEHHIRRPFKEANISFPAHPALTMLQTNELLFHLSSAARADLIVLSHRFHYPNCFRMAGSHRRSSSGPPFSLFDGKQVINHEKLYAVRSCLLLHIFSIPTLDEQVT